MWEPRLLQPGVRRLRAPDDGIVSTRRRRGWLARRWLAALSSLKDSHASRLARGRTFAHAGRVRGLWFAPGLAAAEVVDSEPHDVSIRVRVFDDDEWATVVEVLRGRLAHVAALLEGELPTELVSRCDGLGLSLVPSWEEIDGDCDCSDFMLPCVHMASVYHVLADALDGDPFLLLTLRGRTRDQLMAALRETWGDDQALLVEEEEVDIAPPDVDWYASSTRLPPMPFDFRSSSVGEAGLRFLGPPPGQADLIRALGPLYEAGAQAALDVAHQESAVADASRLHGWRERVGASAQRASDAPPRDGRPVEGEEASIAGAGDSAHGLELTERVVDELAQVDSATAAELAALVGVAHLRVRAELVELEKLGIVYRTGQTRGTRWWLG